MKLVKHISEWLFNEKNITFWKHTALIGFLVFMVLGIGVKVLNFQAERNAKKWLKNDIEAYKNPTALVFSDSLKYHTDLEKKRIQEQYNIIQRRALLHLNVMIYYYSRFYMAISMAALCGLLAAVTLIFISKSGWSRANSYVVAVFVFASVVGVHFGAFPVVFKQEENIEENKKLYLRYVALENRLVSYVSTGEDFDSQQKSLNEFIHILDKKLEDLHELPLNLNPSAIPDPTETLKKMGKVSGEQ